MSLEVLPSRYGSLARSQIRNLVLAAMLFSGCRQTSHENRMPLQVGIIPMPQAGAQQYMAFAIGTRSIRSVPVTVSIRSGAGDLYSQTIHRSGCNTVVMDRLCCPAEISVTSTTMRSLIDDGTCMRVPDNEICSGDLIDSDARIAEMAVSQQITIPPIVSLGFTYTLDARFQPAGIFYVGSSIRVPTKFDTLTR